MPPLFSSCRLYKGLVSWSLFAWAALFSFKSFFTLTGDVWSPPNLSVGIEISPPKCPSVPPSSTLVSPEEMSWLAKACKMLRRLVEAVLMPDRTGPFAPGQSTEYPDNWRSAPLLEVPSISFRAFQSVCGLHLPTLLKDICDERWSERVLPVFVFSALIGLDFHAETRGRHYLRCCNC